MSHRGRVTVHTLVRCFGILFDASDGARRLSNHERIFEHLHVPLGEHVPTRIIVSSLAVVYVLLRTWIVLLNARSLFAAQRRKQHPRCNANAVIIHSLPESSRWLGEIPLETPNYKSPQAHSFS